MPFNFMAVVTICGDFGAPKNKDITLTTKVCIVKTMVFPVIMHGCASWTIKKAEHEELISSNCAGEDG